MSNILWGEFIIAEQLVDMYTGDGSDDSVVVIN